jgi:hypothetical protein
VSDLSAYGGKPASDRGRLQGAVPALHIYCGYVTDMLSHSRQENPTCMNSMERLSFNQSSGALNSPVTGAAAHMSLHLNQQCQRADASLYPLEPGQPGYRSLRDASEVGNNPAPPVRGHI